MEIRSSLARYRSALRKRFCFAAVPTSVKFTSSSARTRSSIFDIRGADSLCRWLKGQGGAVAEANQSHIERYVLQHARLPDIH